VSKFEILRETLETLRACGFEPRVEQSKHFKVRWHDRAGRPRFVVISRSPSDRNTIHAARATLRRLLRRAA
jgi:hypothetical protein